MFRRDRIRRRGGFFILKNLLRQREAYCDDAVWCNIVTGNLTLTVGLVYPSPNINDEDNTKIQNVTKEVSKGKCIIMGNL